MNGFKFILSILLFLPILTFANSKEDFNTPMGCMACHQGASITKLQSHKTPRKQTHKRQSFKA